MHRRLFRWLHRSHRYNTKGTPATYHYYEYPGENEPKKYNIGKWAAIAAAAAGGAMIFGGAGFAIGAVGEVFAGVVSAGTAGIEVCAAAKGFAAFLGLIGAAVMGGSALEHAKKYAAEGNTVEGIVREELKQDGPHEVFYVNGDLAKPVDLNAYATPSPLPDGQESWWKEAWKDSLKKYDEENDLYY